MRRRFDKWVGFMIWVMGYDGSAFRMGWGWYGKGWERGWMGMAIGKVG